MMISLTGLTLLIPLLTGASTMAVSDLAVQDLRCEYYVDPLGIDVARPRLSWTLAADPAARGRWQRAWQIQAASTESALVEGGDWLWDSGRVNSDQTNQVEYAGPALASNQTVFWRVRVWDEADRPSAWSGTARWTMGLVAPDGWTAPAIGYTAPPPVTADPIPGERGDLTIGPAPYLRGEFTVARPLRRALAHVTAWGLYDLSLNGQRVGPWVLTPGWPDHRKRNYYNTYDVTALLHPGRNAAGAILGDGWFAGHVGTGRKFHEYREAPRFSLHLLLEYEDGAAEIVTTGADWKAAYGPILESDLQMGEAYDARLELGDWTAPGYDDSAWDPAEVMPTEKWAVSAYPGSPAARVLERETETLTEPAPGVYLFDLGQNIVGWVRLRVRGEAGTTVRLRFGEMLNPDGSLYTANLRGARCIDRYILHGRGEEVWEPRFTFHGFRYVEVTGYPGAPAKDAITGVVVHADAPLTSHFECSNPMLNQLNHNTVWGQRGNFLEAPTDCPQRDERLGWTGDAQVYIRTAAYHMDIAAFFRKWLVDLADTQAPSGALADTAPNGQGHDDSPAWTDAMILCPHALYRAYGDTRVIRTHYATMQRYLDFVKDRCVNLIRPDAGYGDWLSLGAHTPKNLIGTACFAHMAALMAEMAEAIGERDDAERYQALHAAVRAAFAREYINDKGRLKTDTQTAYALMFGYGLTPENHRKRLLADYIRNIQYRSWHLSTGFVGTPLLLPSLTAAGRTDVAYRLLMNETFPSWGYPIRHGATTVWERWDGWTEEFGFQDPGMNSFNHYAYGAVGEWMFAHILGIDDAEPGFRQVRVQPRPGGGLTSAKGHYDSIRGRIATAWTLDGDRFVLEVEIPVNTSAAVVLPVADPGRATESGTALQDAPGVEDVHIVEEGVALTAASGRYRFECRLD